MKIWANTGAVGAMLLFAGCLADDGTHVADTTQDEMQGEQEVTLSSESSALIAIDPCSRVRCAAGTTCKVIKGRPFCVADPVECKQDSDCRLFSNYCEGCSCVALSTSERNPVCNGNIVQCFVDPCLNHTAQCERGQCVDGSAY